MMKKLIRNKKVINGIAIILFYIVFALAVIGTCKLRDWNIQNQCNNGVQSMCEIMGN